MISRIKRNVNKPVTKHLDSIVLFNLPTTPLLVSALALKVQGWGHRNWFFCPWWPSPQERLRQDSKASFSEPKAGVLTTKPQLPWNCTSRCFKCCSIDEDSAYREITQNDYKMVQIGGDSCARLEHGRPSLAQAQPWVWPQRVGKEPEPSWLFCWFAGKVAFGEYLMVLDT
jgi:hypothetical protein